MQRAVLCIKMFLLRYSTAVICAVFIITGAVSGEDVKKAVGDEVSFRPNEINPSVSSIIWKHRNSNGVVVKAIEWDVEDPGYSIPNQRFSGITTLDEKTGEITITNLNVKHSGLYTIDINSKEQEQKFTLIVMERVPKPDIKIERSSNADVVYLRCEYNETIIWKNSTGVTLKGQKNHSAGEIIIVKNTRNPENYYTCTLENTVSNATSDPVYERDLFGTGKTESNAGLIVGIVILVILLIIISLICVYLLSESIYNRVNNSCPWIESLLRPIDCCTKRRLQYNPASKGDEKKQDAVSPDQKNSEENRVSDATQIQNQ